MSEVVAQLRAERHKFYDTLLVKILGFPDVQETIRESMRDTEWNKEHGWTDYNFETNAIENFMEGDDQEIFRVEEIWNKVKEAVRGKVEDITHDPKELTQHGYLRIDSIVNDTLEEIAEELQNALDRKWQRGRYAKQPAKPTEESK